MAVIYYNNGINQSETIEYDDDKFDSLFVKQVANDIVRQDALLAVTKDITGESFTNVKDIFRKLSFEEDSYPLNTRKSILLSFDKYVKEIVNKKFNSFMNEPVNS